MHDAKRTFLLFYFINLSIFIFFFHFIYFYLCVCGEGKEGWGGADVLHQKFYLFDVCSWHVVVQYKDTYYFLN